MANPNATGAEPYGQRIQEEQQAHGSGKQATE